MHVDKFVSTLELACSSKTLYVSGCFGAPMNSANKKRYSSNNSYNRNSNRQAMILAASSDTFGFDCCNLIKGVIWGWNGNVNHVYGGAVYGSQGLPDIGEDALIMKCPDATDKNWSKIEIGEVVWIPGHIGVYVGDNTVIESSPKWKNGVQKSFLGNVPNHQPGNTRVWTKHGHLPYIDYTRKEDAPVTYEQFCGFMDRYLKERSELPTPDWSKEDWDLLFENKVVANKEWPLSFATRSDVVAFVARAFRILKAK